jgi:hypothetical protein
VLWQLSMAWLIAFHEHSYELHLDSDRFRVYDIFGNVAHDVRWTEVVQLIPVNVNAYSMVVIGWICSPRRPKQGRLRWRRGSKDDDGCMPDTYGMPAERLLTLMHEHASVIAGRGSRR